ncbi:DUF1330 domain-containing protein [Mangrovimicrobium sediminis]|uniref:DUF1330 domain-containing protein n=1 Tax=Mangrovimicrobium sediminis TaxID=2562682 RepID=A0A4Z0LXE9_9GAMM|nr:DUF1330 domain-containing protein [Haliea sp. SAOS-164]TGD71755.1 DUF1330 domain-containing protein [Haliea sp. SAOS-164]
MPAYVIVYQETEIRDPDSLAEYKARTRAARGEHALTPRVVYGAIEPLEGQPPEAVIMVEFPTVEEARAWYNSPEYQDALPYRLGAADYRAIIVEGI